jgi:hypothetical protein
VYVMRVVCGRRVWEALEAYHSLMWAEDGGSYVVVFDGAKAWKRYWNFIRLWNVVVSIAA